ncbi:MAG: hypothetical protein ACREXW_09445 [Gammaproteobacteria bacterium]
MIELLGQYQFPTVGFSESVDLVFTGTGCTALSIVPALLLFLEGCSCLSSHEVARSDNHTARWLAVISASG